MNETYTTIKAQRATVKFCEGVEVDGYKMPNGNYRVSLSGASTLLGYEKTWLSQMVRKQQKALKALQAEGFTGCQFEVSVNREDVSGASTVQTISLDDLTHLIVYAASKGKPQAIALNKALVGTNLQSYFRSSFGDKQLTVAEKQAAFAGYYYENETDEYILPGDDNPRWNNATNLIIDYNWKGEAVYA